MDLARIEASASQMAEAGLELPRLVKALEGRLNGLGVTLASHPRALLCPDPWTIVEGGRKQQGWQLRYELLGFTYRFVFRWVEISLDDKYGSPQVLGGPVLFESAIRELQLRSAPRFKFLLNSLNISMREVTRGIRELESDLEGTVVVEEIVEEASTFEPMEF